MMMRYAFLMSMVCLTFALPVQAASWNDPQGELVRLPGLTVSDTARPRDSLEDRTSEIVEQARIAMRRAAQARKLQAEAEQRRRVVETAAMEQAEAAQQMRRQLTEQQNRDQQVRQMAQNEQYEEQFKGMSAEDRRTYQLAEKEKQAAQEQLREQQLYQQALQERRDQRIRELALQEQQELQDQRIRELALREQQELQDQRIRELAAREQQELQDQRIRELALQEQQESREARLRELALRQQQAEQAQKNNQLARQQRPAEAALKTTAKSADRGGASAAVVPLTATLPQAPATGAEPLPVKDLQVSGPAVLATLPAATVEESYLLGAGDVLYVSVWKDEALTRQLTVTPDGFFSFPLIGAVQAAGKTLSQLKLELEQRLSPYVPDPVLSLELKQVNSMFIFVLGRVNSPGRFALNAPVNVLQALAIAGGLTPYADEEKIQVIREEAGDTRAYLFNYQDVTRGRQLASNIRLQRGDVLLIP